MKRRQEQCSKQEKRNDEEPLEKRRFLQMTMAEQRCGYRPSGRADGLRRPGFAGVRVSSSQAVALLQLSGSPVDATSTDASPRSTAVWHVGGARATVARRGDR